MFYKKYILIFLIIFLSGISFAGAFRLPFDGRYQITQTYNKGTHLADASRFGIDFIKDGDVCATWKQPVYAVKGGTVSYVINNATCIAGNTCGATGAGSGGNLVVINHGKSISRYLHLSEVYVAQDEPVSEGKRIGLTGNTGYAIGTGDCVIDGEKIAGPHFHFDMQNQNTGKACRPEPLGNCSDLKNKERGYISSSECP